MSRNVWTLFNAAHTHCKILGPGRDRELMRIDGYPEAGWPLEFRCNNSHARVLFWRKSYGLSSLWMRNREPAKSLYDNPHNAVAQLNPREFLRNIKSIKQCKCYQDRWNLFNSDWSPLCASDTEHRDPGTTLLSLVCNICSKWQYASTEPNSTDKANEAQTSVHFE